jgi:nucleoid-associated protein YgaU
MASAPSKLASAAVLLLGLWIITYWITPAPANQGVKISFGEAPSPAPVSAPAPPERASPRSTPTPAPTQAEPETEATEPQVLVEVDPEELRDDTSSTPAVIPPTLRRYTTQSGDTFQRIAGRFYGSPGFWRVVAKANPDVDPNRLGPGVQLWIPVDPENIQGKLADGSETQPTMRTPEPEYTEYVVQRGDTLSDISKSLYGRASLWQRIVDANPGVDPNRLRPGTTLLIPPPPAAN